MIIYLVSSIGWHDKEKPLKAFSQMESAKRYAQRLGVMRPWETAGDGHEFAWTDGPTTGDTYQYAIRPMELE